MQFVSLGHDGSTTSTGSKLFTKFDTQANRTTINSIMTAQTTGFHNILTFAIMLGFEPPEFGEKVPQEITRLFILTQIDKFFPNFQSRFHFFHSQQKPSNDDNDDDESPTLIPTFARNLSFKTLNLFKVAPIKKKGTTRLSIADFRNAALAGVLDLVRLVKTGVQTGGRVVVAAHGNCWLNILAMGILRAHGMVTSKDWQHMDCNQSIAKHQVVKGKFVFSNNEISTIKIVFTSHGGSESGMQSIEAAGKDAKLFLEALDITNTREDMLTITIDEGKLLLENNE